MSNYKQIKNGEKKENKIKVVEFTPRLELGGVEAVLMNYIGHLHNRDKFEIHVIAQNVYDIKCARRFEELGIKVHFVTHKRKSIIKNIVEIWKILKREKYDVVHSHMTLTNFYVLIMAKVLRTRVRISHSHNAFKVETWKQKFVWPILKCLNRWSANVWATCGYDAGAFLFGEKAMNDGRVMMMNNAIDVQLFKYNIATRNKIRLQLGIRDEFVIGHIGRFMEQKNHDFLIDIFAQVLKIIPDTKLLLVGDGELKNDIYEKVQQLDIEKSVIFTGNIPNPEEYYQAMDVFVLPSLFEGLPVVSIEAQASGLPCFISDKVDIRCKLTSTVEFLPINKGVSLWVEEIVSCQFQCRNENATEEIVNNGYSIENEANKLEKLYQS